MEARLRRAVAAHAAWGWQCGWPAAGWADPVELCVVSGRATRTGGGLQGDGISSSITSMGYGQADRVRGSPCGLPSTPLDRVGGQVCSFRFQAFSDSVGRTPVLGVLPERGRYFPCAMTGGPAELKWWAEGAGWHPPQRQELSNCR